MRVTALRSRSEDVPELVRYFLGRHRTARDLTLSTEAEQALRIYPWPGNVRELERLVERALAMMESDRIELDDLPARIRGEFAEVLAPSIGRDETSRLGVPLRAAGLREMWAQQAPGVPEAQYQLSHAGGVSARGRPSRPRSWPAAPALGQGYEWAAC